LPAPLLFINGENEIARMEVDGTTTATLTTEDDLIIDFALAPDGSTIAYITIAEADQRSTLVRINGDGTGRAELASGIIRGVTIAADGSVQAGALFDAVAADGAALQAGTWSFPADGGAPVLLAEATDPSQDAAGSITSGLHYQPLAWSPDSSKLLLRTTANNGPDGPAGDIGSTGLAIYDVGAIQSRDLLPLGQEPLCVMPAWSRTSDAIYCANSATIGPPTPSLWRLDLGSGEQEEILPADGQTAVAFNPRDQDDGLYVLVGSTEGGVLRLTPERILNGGVELLLPAPIETGFDGGLWAPDGSGVVYGQPTASANRIIVWQPLGAGDPVELLNGSIGKLVWVEQE
jgi:Tol biopolymer transport system component